MWRVLNKVIFGRNTFNLKNNIARSISKHYIEINEEVKQAIFEKKPVVALESTIITHGMPYPINLECAQQVETIVKEKGATPATIAILGGKIKVGLTEDEITLLADRAKSSKTIKTSRRDLAFVIGNKLNGGTTVAGTLIIANEVGIPIFATGGIGGVHRMGEKTFDISADLTELGKTPVAVISSGVKSILDIPKTLEYLETQGVFVATFSSNKKFPAFYCRDSKCESPYNVRNAKEAANIIGSHLELNLESGMLFAVPIPEEFAMNEDEMNRIIEKAMISAKKCGVSGKEITPYLLSHINEITKGSSLQSNIALIKNNAAVAADIALELSYFVREGQLVDYRTGSKRKEIKQEENYENDKVSEIRPVVIGGSIMDCCATLKEPNIMLDGRIHQAEIKLNGGGVGRNITEAMSKLGYRPTFISVVGNDSYGEHLCSLLPPNCTHNVSKLSGISTSQCTVIFDQSGDCKLLVGDMSIHEHITSEMILKHEDTIRKSPLLVLDGNLSSPAMETALKLAEKHQVPVFYEPTDVPVSIKPFQTSHWQSVKYITPNMLELQEISRTLGIFVDTKNLNPIEDATIIAKQLVKYIPNVIVTLGSNGLLIVNYGNAADQLQNNYNKIKENVPKVKYYPAEKIDKIINVSGAGDCLASGLIAAMLNGMSEEKCVQVGFQAARAALLSHRTVPNKLFDKDSYSSFSTASYEELS